MTPGLSLVLIIWNILLTLLLLYGWFMLRGFFPHKKRGLYKVIEDTLEKGDRIKENIISLQSQLSNVQKEGLHYYKKFGIVRFNPFERIGGEQSYSVALLNEDKSGFVMTFLYMREGMRVYIKEVKNGKGSGVDLSHEEEKAIVQAS